MQDLMGACGQFTKNKTKQAKTHLRTKFAFLTPVIFQLRFDNFRQDLKKDNRLQLEEKEKTSSFPDYSVYNSENI